jgi:hypothetical protein
MSWMGGTHQRREDIREVVSMDGLNHLLDFAGFWLFWF